MSEIKVDTLTGKTTAKTVTVTVGATATQSLEQGLVKTWIAFDGSAATAHDSLNVASETDNGTGDYTFNFTSNFNAAKAYTSGQSVQLVSSSYMGSFIAGASVVLTSSIQVRPTRNTSGGMLDSDYNTINCCGDLA
jgi:hypothetical protein